MIVPNVEFKVKPANVCLEEKLVVICCHTLLSITFMMTDFGLFALLFSSK